MSGESTTPSEGGMNRRQFLKLSLMAGGGVALAAWGLHFWKGRAPYKPGIHLAGAAAHTGHVLRDGSRKGPFKRRGGPRLLIVGAGISGLSAAWHLHRAGFHDFEILDLEPRYGGNSQYGSNALTPYPWGAHYLPLPDAENLPLLSFLTACGVISGVDAATGLPLYREEYLCHDPHERLLLHGLWQEGLVPRIGVKPEENAKLKAFFDYVHALRDRRGQDGRRAFALPVDASSTDAEFRDLDRRSLAEWVQAQGWNCAPLDWYLDYCCLDDFGTQAQYVSAWAGLHYFASRSGAGANAPAGSVLTWPQGNGWLMEKLAAPFRDRIHCHSLALAVRREEEGRYAVDVWLAQENTGETVTADCVLLATPRFVTTRLLALAPEPEFTYAPWVVANVHLSQRPGGNGAPLSWDNVAYGRPSLGYIVATHQALQGHTTPETVLTWYYAPGGADPRAARQAMYDRSEADWAAECLADLEFMHPGIGETVLSVEVWKWGHGMIRPAPGFVWGAARQAAARQQDGVILAHTDLSGMSLFEEGFAQGYRAAQEAAAMLGIRLG